MSQVSRRALIAVVDDEESIRKSLRRLFLAAQLDAVVFASGQEFLESLRLRQPDCLVLDLQMPGLTGLEVQRVLTGSGVRFPTIIITAHDEPETRARCLTAGAAAYLLSIGWLIGSPVRSMRAAPASLAPPTALSAAGDGA